MMIGTIQLSPFIVSPPNFCRVIRLPCASRRLQRGESILSLDLMIDRQHSVALYLQISEQIKDRICDGRCPAGMRLPTIRQMAADLGVTRLTVQNAYGELQNAGWIEATVGRGTFVGRSIQPRIFAHGLDEQLTPDMIINDILQVNQVIGLRSFASASPDCRLFPTDEFWETLLSQRPHLAAITSYGSSQGDPLLRNELAQLLHERDIPVEPDDILVIAGVTQGLSMIAQALTQPGDVVMVEEPTYLGLLHTLKVQGVRAVGVPFDSEGPQLEAVERVAVQQRPRYFYTVATFQNPTGRCMSLTRRQDLLVLAKRYGFLLVEDDIYARLAYTDGTPPPLRALDTDGSVVHLGSFSKVLMPGLRLGYLVAPRPLHERLLSLRRGTDLCSPPLLQRTLAGFLHDGGLKRHLRRVLPIYDQRRRALISALQRYLPQSVEWTRPTGGFCCWLTFPRHHACGDLQQAALRQGWAFAPGEVFLAEPDGRHHLRICFGNQSAESISSAIEVLSRLVRERLTLNMEPDGAPGDWPPLV